MPLHNHSSSMEIQNPNNSANSETINTSMSNLQKFLQNYNRFLQQNVTIQLNSQVIVNDIANNILQPPKSISQSSQQLFQLYQKGKQLPQLLNKQNPNSQMQQLVNRLKKLKQDKIYQTIMYIEQLNYKLKKQYQHQVNRGIQNGVYSSKGNKQGNAGNEPAMLGGMNRMGQGHHATREKGLR